MKQEQNRKCSHCGGILFETVDITPDDAAVKRQFTRCKHCGTVVAVSPKPTATGRFLLPKWIIP